MNDTCNIAHTTSPIDTDIATNHLSRRTQLWWKRHRHLKQVTNRIQQQQTKTNPETHQIVSYRDCTTTVVTRRTFECSHTPLFEQTTCATYTWWSPALQRFAMTRKSHQGEWFGEHISHLILRVDMLNADNFAPHMITKMMIPWYPGTSFPDIGTFYQVPVPGNWSYQQELEYCTWYQGTWYRTSSVSFYTSW